MNIFVGCSASNDISSEYYSYCKNYLNDLLKDNNLIFGASDEGIMGMAYYSASNAGNKIIGVCPKIYKDNLKYINCCKEVITDTIIERTDKLFKYADALVFLPGGLGTLHELFTAIEMKRNGEFDKPIVLYNCQKFFDKLLDYFPFLIENGFVKSDISEIFYVSHSAQDTLKYLAEYGYKSDKIKL